MSSVNQHLGDHVAATPTGAPGPKGGPLDALLKDIRGGRGSLCDRVSTLVPFPTALPSPDDASITSLRCSFGTGNQVHLTVEYQTDLTLNQVADLHRSALSNAGISLDEPISTDPGLVVVHGHSPSPNAQSPDAAEVIDSTVCAVDTHICADEHRGRRRVQIALAYTDYDTAATLEAYANWHEQSVQFEAAKVERFEIKTLETRFSPSFAAIYTTGYRFAGTTLDTMRPTIEHRLSQAGWTWLEPEPGVLFLAGAFDAELHLRQDGADTVIDIVGEFDVALDPAD